MTDTQGTTRAPEGATRPDLMVYAGSSPATSCPDWCTDHSTKGNFHRSDWSTVAGIQTRDVLYAGEDSEPRLQVAVPGNSELLSPLEVRQFGAWLLAQADSLDGRKSVATVAAYLNAQEDEGESVNRLVSVADFDN